MHDLGKAALGYYEKNENTGKFSKGVASSAPHEVLSENMIAHSDFKASQMVLDAILTHNGLYTDAGKDAYLKHQVSLLGYLIHISDMISAFK